MCLEIFEYGVMKGVKGFFFFFFFFYLCAFMAAVSIFTLPSSRNLLIDAISLSFEPAVVMYALRFF